MQRRTGRKIECHRAETTLESTLVGVHAGVVTQALGGEKGAWTVNAQMVALLQMRSIVLAYAGLALEHAIAKRAFVQRLLDVRVLVPDQHRFVAELE